MKYRNLLVLKFGGSSMATSDSIRKVMEIAPRLQPIGAYRRGGVGRGRGDRSVNGSGT